MCNFSLAFDVRLLCENNNFYFRKGIWNTIDGVVDISKYENSEDLKLILQKLIINGCILEAEIEKLNETEKEIFTDLIKSDFIIQQNSDYTSNIIKYFTGQNYQLPKQEDDFFLVTDLEQIEDLFIQNKKLFKYKYSKFVLIASYSVLSFLLFLSAIYIYDIFLKSKLRGDIV